MELISQIQLKNKRDRSEVAPKEVAEGNEVSRNICCSSKRGVITIMKPLILLSAELPGLFYGSTPRLSRLLYGDPLG